MLERGNGLSFFLKEKPIDFCLRNGMFIEITENIGCATKRKKCSLFFFIKEKTEAECF